MDKQPYVVLRAILPDGPTPPPGTRTRDSSRSDRPLVRLRVETEELKSGEVQRLRQQRDVLGIAPPLPLRLVDPKEKTTAATDDNGSVAWGIRAVRADKCTWTA